MLAALISQFFRYWADYGLVSAVRQAKKWLAQPKIESNFGHLLVRDFVSSEDLLCMGETSVAVVAQPKPAVEDILWILPPFSVGSGGVATISNILRAQQKLGLQPKIAVYAGDKNVSIESMRKLATTEYRLKGLEPVFVDELDDESYRAVIATGWQTAYAARKVQGSRHFYLVQDFEPDFYPAGTMREMAWHTYSFGFETLTIGPWLPSKLCDVFGIRAAGFPLPYDSEVFNLGSRPTRTRQLVCYQRPGTPRRLSEIVMAAIQVLESIAPGEFDIHLVGGGLVPKTSPRVTHHEHLSVFDVADLLRRSTDALVLSATNPSLFPKEAMACGVRVVTNDSEANRRCLPDTVEFPPLAPRKIAEALLSAHRHTPDELVASVEGEAWKFVGPELARALS